jgi:transcriptional regulator with XRE-family HTH domain
MKPNTPNNPKDIEVGKRIRQLRLDHGLTQLALSTKADIGPNTLARLERGEHTLSMLTLEKLTKALGVKSGDILGY